jgi:FG-GAP-like repeat
MKPTSFRIILTAAHLFFVVCTGNAALAQTNDQIVGSFFPQALINKSAQDEVEGGPRPMKVSEYAQGDLNADGSIFIVAAYSNGFGGSVRVLRKTGTNFALAYESTKEKLGGDFPDVKLRDIDGDGRPEVIVTFISLRGPREVWVYKWNGSALDLISPSETDEYGYRDTLLSEASFLDLDGDGKLELVQSTGPGPFAPDETLPIPAATVEIFKLEGGKYVFLSNEFYQQSFYIRQTGSPGVESTNFNAENPNSIYAMSIINGAQSGTNRVSSARLSLMAM